MHVDTPGANAPEAPLGVRADAESLDEVILTHISDTVLITDERGAFTYVCPNVVGIFGYTDKEVWRLGNVRHVLGDDRFDPAELDRTGELQNIEWEAADRHGRKHSLLVNVRRVAIGGGTRLYVCRDVSDWKSVERDRDVLFTRSLNPICIADLEGRVKNINPACVGLFGYSPEEVAGKPFLEFCHPDDREIAVAEFAKVTAGASSMEFELRCLCKDGSYRRVVWNTAPIPERGLLFAVGQDNTERRRMEAELREREAQLRQTQKMEAVGQLAGGVAHDFNNLLTVILGSAEVALDPEADENLQNELLREIQGAAQRAASLTRKLLAFSRRQVLEPVVLDLNLRVSDMEKLLRRLIGENITLSTRLEDDLGLIYVDRGELEQIILNLAVNARDAMPDGGELILETRNVHQDELDGQLGPDAPAGPCVMLAVQDTGCGMTDEVKSRLFEPFFTTKEQGKGTGMGLATVFGIVTQSNGRIVVESAPGEGATFRIYFPRAAEPEPHAAPEKDSRFVRCGVERILLVEDDEAVRTLTQRVLTRCGYHVIAATRPGEALSLLSRCGGELDLLLTDVVMPEMSGRRLADLVRTAHPHVKTLYMSGYNDGVLTQHGAEGDGPILKKPFTRDSLAAKVRQALDRADRPTAVSLSPKLIHWETAP